MRNVFAGRLIGIGLLLVIVIAIFELESRPGIPHVHLYSFGLGFLCLGILTALSPGRLRSACLLVASLAFGITLTEGFATWKEPKTDLTGIVEFGEPAPIIGWDAGPVGTHPSSRVNVRTGATIFDVTYTIDADHTRHTRSAATGGSIVFFGDSLTFGDGVNDAETMPQQFADLFDGRRKVVNLGVSGFSPSQVLAELQTGLKDRIIGKAPLAFVMLTGPFHLVRTACKESWTIRAPRYELRDGHLDFVGACAEGAASSFRRFIEHTASYRVFVKPLRMRTYARDVETYIEIVAEVSRLAKAKYGVETIVPYIGGPVAAPKEVHDRQAKLLPIWGYLPGTGYDDDQVIAALRARGVHVVDMTLRDEAMRGEIIGIPGDGHPTPFAHRRRAEMLVEAMKAMDIVPGDAMQARLGGP